MIEFPLLLQSVFGGGTMLIRDEAFEIVLCPLEEDTTWDFADLVLFGKRGGRPRGRLELD